MKDMFCYFSPKGMPNFDANIQVIAKALQMILYPAAADRPLNDATPDDWCICGFFLGKEALRRYYSSLSAINLQTTGEELSRFQPELTMLEHWDAQTDLHLYVPDKPERQGQFVWFSEGEQPKTYATFFDTLERSIAGEDEQLVFEDRKLLVSADLYAFLGELLRQEFFKDDPEGEQEAFRILHKYGPKHCDLLDAAHFPNYPMLCYVPKEACRVESIPF